MDQRQNTLDQESQEKDKLLTTEKVIERALQTLEDLAANAKSMHVRKLATKKLQQYKRNLGESAE
jgi:hypothetical protein